MNARELFSMMGNWRRLAWIGFVVAGALPSTPGSSDRMYEYRWFSYRAGELRILMDTSIHEMPFYAHSDEG